MSLEAIRREIMSLRLMTDGLLSNKKRVVIAQLLQCATDAEARLEAVRAALIGTGYFTESEIGSDLAPRITELLAALSAAPQPEPVPMSGCACGHTCDHGPHDQELNHDPEPPASDETEHLAEAINDLRRCAIWERTQGSHMPGWLDRATTFERLQREHEARLATLTTTPKERE